MSAVVVLLAFLGFVACVATVRAAAAPGAPGSMRLRQVQQRTRRWRWAGLLLGVAVAAVAMQQDPLGRGALLAAPLLTICVLTGVLVGELRIAAPAGPTRRASLEVRRVRDYLPRRLAGAVAAAAGLLAVVLTMTTAIGRADDMGRAGRTLFRQCSPVMSEANGPWPGSFYSAPLAAIVLAGLVAAAFALHRVVRRPRQGEDLAVDDALRRQAAEAVTAASGLLVAVPFAGVSLFAGSALLRVSCRPWAWTVAGWTLLLLVPALIGLAAWCATALAFPTGTRERPRTDAPARS